MSNGVEVVSNPCAQGTKALHCPYRCPTNHQASALLHTGEASLLWDVPSALGKWSEQAQRQDKGETGSRVQHLQPAWCCQGWDLPQACSPCHVSLCLEGSVPSVSRPCTFLSSRKAPDAIGRQGLCSLPGKLQEVGEAWHAAMSIFFWSSLPGPQVLVPSAVGVVARWLVWPVNVAGELKRHFYDRPIRYTPTHTLPPPHSIPTPRFLFSSLK